MAILNVKDPITGEFRGIPAIKGEKGDPGPKGEKGDPGEATGDVSEAMVNFTESTDRTNIETGNTLKVIFGKIKKWFSDLKPVAFTGSYDDLIDAPTPVKDLGVISDTDGINFDEYDDDNCIAYLHNYTLSDVPNANGILRHYKSESSEYRYQEFTKLYNQQTYKRVYWNGVWKDWTFTNSAHVEDLANVDIVAYAEELKTESTSAYFAIARGYNCTNEPGSMGEQGLGDYYYQIFKADKEWITMYATDVRSNTVYTINKNNGTWDVSWRNLRDANTLRGLDNRAFMQHYNRAGYNTINFNHPGYVQPISSNIEPSISASIGLDETWHHMLYLPHDDSNGYAAEIVFPLDSNWIRPKYRIAIGTSWQRWRFINDNVYVESSAPASPAPNDLWIW